MKNGWHIEKSAGQVTVSRQVPARFDVFACTMMEGGNPVRLAMQIRQDMWRALQNLRGFAPVVQLKAHGNNWQVQAGGTLMGPATAQIRSRISAVLEDEKNRARWQRCSQRSNTNNESNAT